MVATKARARAAWFAVIAAFTLLMARNLPPAAAAGPPAANSPYTSNLRTVASFIREDFVPDGNLSKPAWKNLHWVQFDHDMQGDRSYPQALTRVAARWSAHFIYLAYACKYTVLNLYEGEDPARERWGLWDRDVVEAFINPQPERMNHYYELEVAPNNQWIDLEIDKNKTPFNDARWNSGFEHATHIDDRDRVWTCEMRVPVGSMGVPVLRAGMKWRINFYRADGRGPDPQRRFLAWSTIPGGTTFHTPTRFGIIRFAK